MIFRKLKRVWSHNDMNYIPKFKETFPELNKVSSEEMCDRWIELGIDFYTEERVNVPIWIRLTLPFALVTMLIMFILLPINFIITGGWGYDLRKNNTAILNWFRALRLL